MAGGVLTGLGLRKSFNGRLVVAGVDLQVEAGEVTGLLGPNGAGKTTIFRMLTGLERPDAGRVELGGREVTGWPLHQRARAGLGYLSQRSVIFRGLTVLENVALALEARGAGRERCMAVLAEAGLAHLASVAADTLSGGERRRLEIARCLALEPTVLLLDEPFAGVDPVAVGELQQRVRELAARGIGVLITDHAVREALGVCQRVMVLDAGVMQCEGSPEEVAADPRVQERYLGTGYSL